MSAKSLFLVCVVLAVVAAPLTALDDPTLPQTIIEITGRRSVSYPFFFTLAAFCLLLIFRGIKAR